jgi:hypothetical protein
LRRKEHRIDLPAAGGGFYKLYLPSDYPPDRKWPVFFRYKTITQQ